MNDVNIQIPKGALEGVVNAHIRAAVMEALGKDPNALVAKVVDAAMAQKKNSYDRTTVFQDEVAKAIREMASEVFKAWLEEQRPAITKRIRSLLTNKEGRGVADKVVKAMTENIYVSVQLKQGDY